MDKEEVLKELGMSEGEARVYLALLRLGESQVSRIKTETKMHRTTIYDFLDKMAKKGLVSHVVKNNIKFFMAAHPSRLEALIREKREHLEEIIPQLVQISELEKKPLKIDVYEGVEGFKTLLGKIIRESDELLSFGIEEARFEEKFPHIIRSFIRKEQKSGRKERLIAEKGTRFTYKYPHMHYRYIDRKFFSPTPTMIFGKNAGFIIWDPLTIIIIENKDFSDAYRKHFELIWRIADKKP